MKARKLMTAFAILLLAAGCSQPVESGSGPAASQEQPVGQQAASSETSQDLKPGNVLIVNYSWPVTDMGDTDTNTSASVILQDGNVEGNTDYAADIIAQETGFDRVKLETADSYPTDYETLVDQAKEEQTEGYRPALKTLPDLDGYDTVILVTPNWWADLPMPVYSFLEQEDWQGKQIIPVVVHGGSGLSQIPETLEKFAKTDTDKALSLSRTSLMDSEDTIREWAKDL